MDNKRLLIALSSEVEVEDLTQRLAGDFQILCCTDGFQAQSLLQAFRPHIVVLDVMMRGLDGIALMDWIQQQEIPPKILVTTTFMTPFLQRMMERNSFDYLMFKPCDYGVLADRVQELATEPDRDLIMSAQHRFSVAGMLSSLQVSTNHKGFQYLRYGVEVFQPEDSMTKTVYPAIGRQFNVRADAVERDIRRAIGFAWANSDPYTWRMYFESDRNGYVPRPTNSVFISTLARRLNTQKQNQA